MKKQMDSEEEYDDEEPESPEKTPDVKAEDVAHVPKIGNSTGKDFSKIGGGIPRPAPAKDNFMKEAELTPAAMRSSAREFRITANSSRGSMSGFSGTESMQAKVIGGRLPKQRPNLLGGNKPHMLKNQND